MPRKPRIEYPGAVYHIISRGNYRKDLFNVGEGGKAFEKALFEAADRCGWKLHAYVIMSNHYHLAVELTDSNLVDGMKWLQSTFANRFNRFTGERGHVFQGRYKSIIIEPDRPLLSLVNYIHLNPVRAGLCSVADLKEYKLSSFPKLFSRNPPTSLNRERFLAIRGFPNSAYGMKSYHEYLQVCEESDSEKKSELSRKFCRGWILAGDQFRKDLLKQHAAEDPSMLLGKDGRKELKAEIWEEKVVGLLKEIEKTEEDIQSEGKSIDWKVQIARTMRAQTTASNPWIANRLKMGHPSRVSNLVNQNI